MDHFGRFADSMVNTGRNQQIAVAPLLINEDSQDVNTHTNRSYQAARIRFAKFLEDEIMPDARARGIILENEGDENMNELDKEIMF